MTIGISKLNAINFIKTFTISTPYICYIYGMRHILSFCLLISSVLYSQNAMLAKDYFQKGEYEKALIEYENLYAKSSSNINYINQIISTHQQLEQYIKIARTH